MVIWFLGIRNKAVHHRFFDGWIPQRQCERKCGLPSNDQKDIPFKGNHAKPTHSASSPGYSSKPRTRSSPLDRSNLKKRVASQRNRPIRPPRTRRRNRRSNRGTPHRHLPASHPSRHPPRCGNRTRGLRPRTTGARARYGGCATWIHPLRSTQSTGHRHR